jgi:hypothetical protein
MIREFPDECGSYIWVVFDNEYCSCEYPCLNSFGFCKIKDFEECKLFYDPKTCYLYQCRDGTFKMIVWHGNYDDSRMNQPLRDKYDKPIVDKFIKVDQEK